jgi:alpha-ketoglutarate-dependent taurine dioxygenase
VGIIADIESSLAFLNPQRLPAVISPARLGVADTGLLSLLRLFERERPALRELELKYGALLFRGWAIETASDFERLAQCCFRGTPEKYLGGTSPRAETGAGIYESTEFPARLRLPQHNEMSYVATPPAEICFCCHGEPASGGETPLADSRVIYHKLPSAIRDAFEARQVRYSRYYFGPRPKAPDRVLFRLVRLHRSWMDAFATSDPRQVEAICAAQGVDLEWDGDGGAVMTNILPAVVAHPVTGERVWFNQASTFLLSRRSTGAVRAFLYHLLLPEPKRRPFHAAFGDGSPIRVEVVDQINATIDASTVRFPWRKGDFLLVDNYLVAHGRMPFRGPRRVLVAMK